MCIITHTLVWHDTVVCATCHVMTRERGEKKIPRWTSCVAFFFLVSLVSWYDTFVDMTRSYAQHKNSNNDIPECGVHVRLQLSDEWVMDKACDIDEGETRRTRVLRCVAVCVAVCCSVLRCVAVCCSVLHCALQCVAVCCSVLQCATHRHTGHHALHNQLFWEWVQVLCAVRLSLLSPLCVCVCVCI